MARKIVELPLDSALPSRLLQFASSADCVDAPEADFLEYLKTMPLSEDDAATIKSCGAAATMPEWCLEPTATKFCCATCAKFAEYPERDVLGAIRLAQTC